MTTPIHHHAVIVSHGQPSDPAPAEAELASLAAAVARLLPSWRVTSATLADEASLARAVSATQGVVYPMFMSDGWFTTKHLPQRLAAIGGAEWRILPPFGLDPRVQSLAVTLALEACHDHPEAEVLLAAHGSFRSPAPADVAYVMVQHLLDGGIMRAKAGFIDQSPRIVDVARSLGRNAICLPFFAANGGHVITDLPQALNEAGFEGRLLPPVGSDPRVPGLIADALLAARG